MLTPTIEPELQTPDEREYAALSAKITALDIEVVTAQQNLAAYCHANPLRTAPVREHIIHLQDELDTLLFERQRLLLPWCEAKSRVNGW